MDIFKVYDVKGTSGNSVGAVANRDWSPLPAATEEKKIRITGVAKKSGLPEVPL